MKDSSPLVSIIIPVYNTGSSAKSLIKSLLKDSYKNLEIIAVDDGSTDDSLALLKSLSDPRLIIKSKENGGASSARNLGLSLSKGKYLLFIDSDDEVSPAFISRLVKEAEAPKVSLCVSGIRYKKLNKNLETLDGIKPFFKKKNESTKSLVLRSLLTDGRMYAVFNKIFQSKVIKSNSIRFDESLNFAEDTKFVLDYLKFAKGEIKFILEPLYIYNFGTETSTIKKSGKIWNNWQTSFKNLKQWVGKSPTLREKFLLLLIHCRWYVSYRRSKNV
ncbi:glycosyltransferase family 2 protein [Candidatus Saccharibacteria bacterium]|nr:glycosyltransferase family 2 protein [Candidatus Saccharibacteria bacterium]